MGNLSVSGRGGSVEEESVGADEGNIVVDGMGSR